jgi:ATP-dependent RNA helicase DBP3
MLDMGFEKDMRQIVLLKDMPKVKQTAMFSATFPVPIQKLAADFMNNTSLFIKVGKVATTKVGKFLGICVNFQAITQTVKYVHDKEKGFVVVKDLNAQTEGKALGRKFLGNF